MNINKKLFEIVIIIAMLLGVILTILKLEGFAAAYNSLFLISGCLLLISEIRSQTPRKLILKIALIILPLLVIALTIQSLLTNTSTLSAILIAIGMYFLLSDKSRFAFLKKKS